MLNPHYMQVPEELTPRTAHNTCLGVLHPSCPGANPASLPCAPGTETCHNPLCPCVPNTRTWPIAPFLHRHYTISILQATLHSISASAQWGHGGPSGEYPEKCSSLARSQEVPTHWGLSHIYSGLRHVRFWLDILICIIYPHPNAAESST